MITYSKKGCRHTFGMNNADLKTFAEIMWLLRTTPPPVGYNRKPFTFKQQKCIEEMFDRLSYPENYPEMLNKINGQ